MIGNLSLFSLSRVTRIAFPQNVRKELSVFLSNVTPTEFLSAFNALQFASRSELSCSQKSVCYVRGITRIDQTLALADDPSEARRIMSNNWEAAGHGFDEYIAESLLS